jgi:poly(3-hydroxybutyrate) depolymerase
MTRVATTLFVLCALASVLSLSGLACSRCSAPDATGTLDMEEGDALPPIAMPAMGDASSAVGGALRAPGCGKPQSSPRGLTLRTKGGRTFHVYGPAEYDPTRAYPVVFAFHGWESSGPEFQKWFKMEDHVASAAFTVYPDALAPGWDVARDRDLAFVSAMRVGLANAYCIDLARLYAFGFSYGGKFVHHLGCRRPDIIRAISVGDGSWGHSEEASCKPLPVLVTHRTRDPDELIEWGRAAAEAWTRVDACAKDTDVTDAEHGCVTHRGCKAPVVVCEDTYFNASWPRDWNHTVREEYRDLTWRWFDTMK